MVKDCPISIRARVPDSITEVFYSILQRKKLQDTFMFSMEFYCSSLIIIVPVVIIDISMWKVLVLHWQLPWRNLSLTILLKILLSFLFKLFFFHEIDHKVFSRKSHQYVTQFLCMLLFFLFQEQEFEYLNWV